MKSTRALVAGLGTAGSLVAAAACVFLVASAVIAFNGWPGGGIDQSISDLFVNDEPASVSGTSQPGPGAVVAAGAVAATPTGPVITPGAAGPGAPAPGGGGGDGTGDGTPGDGGSGTTPGTGVGTPPSGGGGGGGGGEGGASVGNVGDTIAPVTDAGSNAVKETTNQVGNTVTNVTNGVADTVAPVSPPVAETIRQTGQTVEQVVKSVGQDAGAALSGQKQK
jgi:hypothetical protein